MYHSLQISVLGFHNDLILLFYQDGFYGAYYKEYNMCIGDISSRKYMSRHIKITGNQYRVTCGYKTHIGSILLQSDLNKLQLSQTFF